jgi:hypothetical protein
MVNHTSIQDFSSAARALRTASPNVRFVIRYGAGTGSEPGHLVAKITDDKSTLTFRTDSKADLKDLDALSLWLLMADLQPDPAAPVAQVVAESAAAAAPARKPREHPSGSGAQRRAAGRARVLAGGKASLPSVRVRLKQRRLEARSERRRLRATGAAVGEKN